MKYKRLVIKLGTNLLTGGGSILDMNVMSDIVRQVSDLHSKGHEIILVSSGAVAAGREKLGIRNKRKDIPFKQVMASFFTLAGVKASFLAAALACLPLSCSSLIFARMSYPRIELN